MAGSYRHLSVRDGRYSARVVIPERLRPILGKRELVAALGGDRREALRKLPGVVASFHNQIDAAERQIAPTRRPRASSAHELARIHYSEALTLDDRECDASVPALPKWMTDGYAKALRTVASGRADNEFAAATIGWAIDKAHRGTVLVRMRLGKLGWAALGLALLSTTLAAPASGQAPGSAEACQILEAIAAETNAALPRPIDEVTELIQIRVNCALRSVAYVKRLIVTADLLAFGWQERKQVQHTQLHCNLDGLASVGGWTAIDYFYGPDYAYLATLRTTPQDCTR